MKIGGENMDKDRLLGALIIVGVVLAAILYFGSIFSPWWSFTQAVQVLVSIAFVAVLGIGGWIGWTMASTPSPEPVEDLETEDVEEEAPDTEDLNLSEEVEGEEK